MSSPRPSNCRKLWITFLHKQARHSIGKTYPQVATEPGKQRAKSEKDARLIEYKDTISQLNMTVKSQNEIIISLKGNHRIQSGTNACHDGKD